MGWLEDLRNCTVALDTAPLIFYLESHPIYASRLAPFFNAVDAGEIRLITSTLTLLEVLVLPLKRGDESLAHQYNDILLSSPHISTVPFTMIIAQTAAELRATTNLKTPDAIQLATAITNHVDAFLTNDRDFAAVTSSVRILKVRDLP